MFRALPAYCRPFPGKTRTKSGSQFDSQQLILRNETLKSSIKVLPPRFQIYALRAGISPDSSLCSFEVAGICHETGFWIRQVLRRLFRSLLPLRPASTAGLSASKLLEEQSRSCPRSSSAGHQHTFFCSGRCPGRAESLPPCSCPEFGKGSSVNAVELDDAALCQMSSGCVRARA